MGLLLSRSHLHGAGKQWSAAVCSLQSAFGTDQFQFFYFKNITKDNNFFIYIHMHNKLILPCLCKEQYFQKMKICEGLNDIK